MSVSEENHLRGIKELIRIFNTDYSVLTTVSTDLLVDTFAGKAFLPAISPLLARTHACDLNRMGLGGRSWICPECIKENTPTPESFNLSLGLCCDAHNLALQDTCHSCKKQLFFQREKRRYCPCGADLSETPRVTTPNWVSKFYSLFAPWRLNGTIITLEFAEVEYLIARFLRRALTTQAIKASLEAYPHFGQNDFERIHFLIQNWPKNFLKLLKARLNVPRTDRIHYLHAPWLQKLPEVNEAMNSVRALYD